MTTLELPSSRSEEWRWSDMGALRAAAERRESSTAPARLAKRRAATQQARDSARSLSHQLATVRARRDTVVRRLGELERLVASVATESAREAALRDDAANAIASLERRGLIHRSVTRNRRKPNGGASENGPQQRTER